MTSFQELGLIDPILKALLAEGYTQPTPIQSQAIPLLLKKRDLLGCAQTGTGKTAAFAVPILQLMSAENREATTRPSIRCLILTPTRELAIQIGESFETYGKNLKFKTKVIYGGVKQGKQVDAIKNGIDILIATPGRLLDLMDQGHVDISRIHYFVLDEADRMLDMGFVHDVKRIISKLPHKRQSLFFSATMPPVIKKLADSILANPAKVEVTPVSSTAEKINQVIYFVDKENKTSLLMDILNDSKIERVLVFTRTKHGADKVTKHLAKNKIPTLAIHGNKSQNARQDALNKFKDKKIRVLIATDIAARGIDIDELTHVINFELPNIPESYVHRIGRTGRAGANGIAIGFCDAEEKAYLKDIQKLIGKEIPVISDHPYPLMKHDVVKASPKPQRPPRSQRAQGGSNASSNYKRSASKKSSTRR
ncbi:MAG: DEAD/DEAH box helicase [Leptospira sp.]|nr:DEAD/DEAH box helicase [Leptospira sp.]